MKTFTSLIFAVSLAIVCTAMSLARKSESILVASPPKGSIDTVKWYSVSTECSTVKGKTTYKVDGVRVSKETYDKYKLTSDDIYACHPCYVRTVSKKEHVYYEGDQVTDCPVGYWKEYYDNGNIKVEGHYKPDSTGVYDLKKSAEWCAIRDGKWTYYGKDGEVDSVVNYVNNVRIK